MTRAASEAPVRYGPRVLFAVLDGALTGDDGETLGQKLLRWRGGRSLAEAARLIGCDYRQLSLWEKDEMKPSTKNRARIAAAYQVPLAEVAGRPSPPPSKEAEQDARIRRLEQEAVEEAARFRRLEEEVAEMRRLQQLDE